MARPAYRGRRIHQYDMAMKHTVELVPQGGKQRLDDWGRDLAPLRLDSARHMHNGRTAAPFSWCWRHRPPHWSLQRDVGTSVDT